MKALFVLLVVLPAGLLAGAWALMLVFGVLHHEVAEVIPPIGFVPALAVSATVGLYRGIGAFFKGVIEAVSK